MKMFLCVMGMLVKGLVLLFVRCMLVVLVCVRVRLWFMCRKVLRLLVVMWFRNRVVSLVVEILCVCSCVDSFLRVSLCMELVMLWFCGLVGLEVDGGWCEVLGLFDDFGY